MTDAPLSAAAASSPNPWTPRRLKTLAEKVAARVSYTEIAAAMGVTKSAVAGAVRRYAIPVPPREGKRKAALLEAPPGDIRAAREPKGCLFIAGDPKAADWGYCQRPRAPGRDYCPEHDERCRRLSNRSPQDSRSMGGT